MLNFNEVFRKQVTYDNNKNHQKSGGKHSFGKTTGGIILTSPQLF